MILDLLAQTLDDAVEYELLSANPARGKRRRLKTAAGIDRHLELSALLVEELRAHVESLPAAVRKQQGSAMPLFPTRTGGRLNPSNIRNRLLAGTPAGEGKGPIKGVVERANEKRAAQGRMLLPATVTPHTLRRTLASLCFFAGRDLRWVMGQLRHDEPRMTLAVYAQCMKGSRIDQDLVWTLMPSQMRTRSPPGGVSRLRAPAALARGRRSPRSRACQHLLERRRGAPGVAAVGVGLAGRPDRLAAG